MSINLQGKNLLFLISQPRAGSTLLQRMLTQHPEIHTVSEPWLLLHPIYALRESGYWFEYDANVAHIARMEFFQYLPNGEDDYLDAMRRMYTHLYNKALAGTGKTFFLDKTPRYYFIIPDLQRLFPEAHFIILLRNPMSVLGSILRTWTRRGWFLLHRRKHDLLDAPNYLITGIKQLGRSCTVIHYEKLINNPMDELEKICCDIGVSFVPDMIDYGSSNIPPWRHGDKTEIDKHSKPNPQIGEKWLDDIKSPQVWRLAYDYLQNLGENTINQMGYSYSDLHQTLINRKPYLIQRWFTYPLWFLVNSFNWTESYNLFERRLDRVIEIYSDYGAAETVRRIYKEIGNIMGTNSSLG